jgi:hypothetical protein
MANEIDGPQGAPDAAAQTGAQFQPMPELSSEDRSKDDCFVRLAVVADAMIQAHGKDFAMGALLLSARFIAEGKPLIRRVPQEGQAEPD